MGKVVPLKFKGFDCPACGSKDSIKFVDRANKVYDNPDDGNNGAYDVRCLNCDYKFSIRWDMDKYIFEDIQKKPDGFMENYTKTTRRDIDAICLREYELPDV